jgi:hypothetical protein
MPLGFNSSSWRADVEPTKRIIPITAEAGLMAEFKIEFEDGSCVSLDLADPGSSVAVRDKDKIVEYLG